MGPMRASFAECTCGSVSDEYDGRWDPECPRHFPENRVAQRGDELDEFEKSMWREIEATRKYLEALGELATDYALLEQIERDTGCTCNPLRESVGWKRTSEDLCAWHGRFKRTMPIV